MKLTHSNQLTEKALHQKNLAPMERYVLGVICSLANKAQGWKMFHSMENLAAICGMSVETLRKHRQRLEALGFIEVEKASVEGHSKYKRNIYTVVIGALGFSVEAIGKKLKETKAFVFNLAKSKIKTGKPSTQTMSDLDIAKQSMQKRTLTKAQFELLSVNLNILSPVERHQLQLAAAFL